MRAAFCSMIHGLAQLPSSIATGSGRRSQRASVASLSRAATREKESRRRPSPGAPPASPCPEFSTSGVALGTREARARDARAPSRSVAALFLEAVLWSVRVNHDEDVGDAR